jgi:hypothetical protein
MARLVFGFRSVTVGCNLSRRNRCQNLRCRKSGIPFTKSNLHCLSPLPEPGSTTQRHTHGCVNERVQQTRTQWNRKTPPLCGYAVANDGML